jgi:7,8-dihydropterin-6-yl-methyl-4-(beta-D-ribofuranosyl)aminobenzene 5'-phosphate synthase
MRIVILADDVAGRRGLLAEHGFSLWLETRDHRVLFDTGQGLALGHNAEALGIPLAAVDAVVLSHGHDDHTGGLATAVSGRRGLPVYAQPEVMSPRYARREGEVREIGMPAAARRALTEHGDFRSSRVPRPVGGGVRVTGAIPRLTEFEDAAGTFYLDADGHEPDPLIDDQAAFVETEAGTVVLLGCGHAGVVNTLRQVEALTTGPIWRGQPGADRVDRPRPRRSGSEVRRPVSLHGAPGDGGPGPGARRPLRAGPRGRGVRVRRLMEGGSP